MIHWEFFITIMKNLLCIRLISDRVIIQSAIRFNVSVDAIKKANGDSNAELKFEQIVLIPTNSGKNTTVCEKTHIVKKGETLYSIAKSNDVSIEDIRKWNHLKKNELKPKDSIVLFLPCTNKEKETKKDKAEKSESKVKNGKEANPKKPVKDSLQVKHRIKTADVTEEGAGTWLDNNEFDKNKNFALHKDAPIGTMIRIVNIMNGREAWVKVVGHLPEKEAKSGLIIIISGYTAKSLNIRDRNFRVKLYYSKTSISTK